QIYTDQQTVLIRVYLCKSVADSSRTLPSLTVGLLTLTHRSAAGASRPGPSTQSDDSRRRPSHCLRESTRGTEPGRASWDRSETFRQHRRPAFAAQYLAGRFAKASSRSRRPLPKASSSALSPSDIRP